MKPALTNTSAVTVDAWTELKQYTNARLALGRAGNSLPTQAVLDFGLAHARARDAVHDALPTAQLMEQLRVMENGNAGITVHSRAENRDVYLQRPDLGRRLREEDRDRLTQSRTNAGFDLALVIADGLSAQATATHALPVIQLLKQRIPDWQIAPIVIAEQSRVALGDEIGEALNAQQVAIFIGERPGLSSPDSMGIYLTYAPRVGRTDAERNCISNIRPQGLSYELAAHKLHALLLGAHRLKLSGVHLKDESDGLVLVNE